MGGHFHGLIVKKHLVCCIILSSSDTHKSIHGPGVIGDLGWGESLVLLLLALVQLGGLVPQQHESGLSRLVHPYRGRRGSLLLTELLEVSLSRLDTVWRYHQWMVCGPLVT